MLMVWLEQRPLLSVPPVAAIGASMRLVTKMRGHRIGEVARATDVSIETIRYWERLGLALAPQRSAQGHRVYEESHIRRLAFLRRARKLGFGLRDLHELVRLAPSDLVSCSRARGIAARHLTQVRARLAELSEIESALARTVNSCASNRGDRCPLIDTLGGGKP